MTGNHIGMGTPAYLQAMNGEGLALGFDAKRLFLNASGLGNYSRTLVHGLAQAHPGPAYHLYTPEMGERSDTREFQEAAPFTIHMPPRGMPGTLWRTTGITKALERDGVRLYHGLSNELPVGIHKSGVRTVATIHDLIFRHYPGHYSRMDRVIYHGKTRYASEHADLVLAISECTRTDILEAYKVSPERVVVAYQSCAPEFYIPVEEGEAQSIRSRHALPPTYLLFVGSVNERKNLLSLVQALELLPESLRLPLVVVGQGGSYLRKVNRYLSGRNLAKLVHFRPGVDSGALPAIYQGAEAFCYPSLYEGFGIPVLEALASGVPVLTSNRSSLPEAGGPGSLYADPGSPEEIAGQLRRILEDSGLRADMIRQGRIHAEGFRLERTTAVLWDLYQGLLS